MLQKGVSVFNQGKKLLSALEQLQKGALTVLLPDGSRATYEGREPGHSAEMQVSRWDVFDRFISKGDVALGEDYIEHFWDTPDLPGFMHFAVENITLFENIIRPGPFLNFILMFKHRLLSNTLTRSRRNVHKHYDLGNDFYRLWLDESMTYSCALFNGDANLDLKQAQKAKYGRILQRLAPKPGDKILDIGCGWGGFMEETATRNHYITGVTISAEQAEYARLRLLSAGLADLTDVRLQDYRELTGPFDHIASIGMFEHVGEAYWPRFMGDIHQYLKPGGRAMIQTIIVPEYRFDSYRNGNDFLREYIFPGGMLPTRKRFERAASNSGLRVKDVFHFGQDYAITLQKWLENFDNRLREVKGLGYDEPFIRKWRFYLAGCMAMFRAGLMDVIQVELTRPSAKQS